MTIVGLIYKKTVLIFKHYIFLHNTYIFYREGIKGKAHTPIMFMDSNIQYYRNLAFSKSVENSNVISKYSSRFFVITLITDSELVWCYMGKDNGGNLVQKGWRIHNSRMQFLYCYDSIPEVNKSIA